jgi:hypothetical protein
VESGHTGRYSPDLRPGQLSSAGHNCHAVRTLTTQVGRHSANVHRIGGFSYSSMLIAVLYHMYSPVAVHILNLLMTLHVDPERLENERKRFGGETPDSFQDRYSPIHYW